MGKRHGALLLLGNSLILFLLLAGGLCAFLSAYQLEVDRETLLTCCALFAGLSVLVWSIRGKSCWAALGLLLVWAVIVWSQRERVHLALLYLRRQVWGSSAETALATIQMQEAKAFLLPAVVLLAMALALLLGWLVVQVRGWYLAAMVVTIPVLPAILNGVLPDWTALLAGTAGWGTMLLTALYDPHDRERLGCGILLSLGGMTVLLGGLSLALPQEGYERPQWATDMRDRIVSTVADGMNRYLDWDGVAGDLIHSVGVDLSGNINNSVGGGIGTGTVGEIVNGELDLRSAGPQNFRGQTVMTVYTDQLNPSGRAYLLAGTAETYDGERWTAVMAALLPPNPAVTAPEAAEYTMTIHHAFGGGRLYTPYRLAQIPPANPGKEYSLLYRPGGPEAGFQALGEEEALDEERYRVNVAYPMCTEVPDRTWDALAPLLAELEQETLPVDPGLPPEHQIAVAAAQRTADYLDRLAVYDLNTPAMEQGDEFIEHFLAEGRGYCVHFATAGVMLLRMQGIPARYASGYVADMDRRGYATVRDSDAHAWAEIYLDGYGWYPVEMTPGYRSGAAVPLPDSAEEVPPAGEPEEPEKTEPLPADPQKPDQPAQDQSIPEPEEDAPIPDQAEQEQASVTIDLSWLKPVGAVLLSAAVLAGVYRTICSLRRRSRTTAETNRSVIDAYVRYQRLRAWGCQEDQMLADLAGKAKFSQHTLTEEERTAAWQRLDNLLHRTEDNLPAWKRWVLHLLSPLF